MLPCNRFEEGVKVSCTEILAPPTFTDGFCDDEVEPWVGDPAQHLGFNMVSVEVATGPMDLSCHLLRLLLYDAL